MILEFTLHNRIKTLKTGELFESHAQKGSVRHFKFELTRLCNVTLSKKAETFH